ncbi:MAG: tRNA guanosine(34) transglycosylase Tgt [Legionellales bacterium]|nr:tRNA guanosine(34) transglycosylase Tgt [Legionellales bacterium]
MTQSNPAIQVEILAQHRRYPARVTKVTTAHGEFITPCFMPVGTRAAVNCMSVEQLKDAGSQIILGGNTYHMLLAPGMEIIQQLRGMHHLMNWHAPMLTDSGGYQVFSLSRNQKICKIDDQGAHFKHPINGKMLHLTPQSSLSAQKIIGADIIMAFDQCTPEEGGRKVAEQALKRTHAWLEHSKLFHLENPLSAYGYPQALFGIIQGGSFRDLRQQSCEVILAMELDGIAIGGEAIGYDMEKTKEILSWLEPSIPQQKTRYTMGVGLFPQDLIEVSQWGIDIYDCVAPTRNARHGALYCGHPQIKEDWLYFHSEEDRGRLLIKKSQYASDDKPICEQCDCYTCQHYSRGYLHYLFKEKQNLYFNLACIHNIRMMHKTTDVMREVIIANAAP